MPVKKNSDGWAKADDSQWPSLLITCHPKNVQTEPSTILAESTKTTAEKWRSGANARSRYIRQRSTRASDNKAATATSIEAQVARQCFLGAVTTLRKTKIRTRWFELENNMTTTTLMQRLCKALNPLLMRSDANGRLALDCSKHRLSQCVNLFGLGLAAAIARPSRAHACHKCGRLSCTAQLILGMHWTTSNLHSAKLNGRMYCNICDMTKKQHQWKRR